VAVSAPVLRALVVPDPAFWGSVGVDVGATGLHPVPAAIEADILAVADAVPEPLAAAVAELGPRVGGAVRILEGAGLAGLPARDLLAGGGEDHGAEHSHEGHGGGEDYAGHEGHDGHSGDDGHDHHDMMAVTGRPSSDGLVMENAEAEIGPVSAALPTGLVVRVTLDGDVVCSCEIEAQLAGPASRPDPLARAAIAWARARASGGLTGAQVARHVAAVEIERARSHTLWLAAFARLLGWPEVDELARSAAAPLIEAHRRLTVVAGDGGADLVDLGPERDLERLASRLARSRHLARRTRGRGRLGAEESRERGLAGPVARASGLDDDLRSTDRAYRELDFEAMVADQGDARSRALVRVEEAVHAWSLARRALDAGELPVDQGPVEGPRGPISYDRDSPVAAGAAESRQVAAELAAGHELARALVVISSFDLSPWRVGA
jgi:hypothetical protein